jgi:hypothetical protein
LCKVHPLAAAPGTCDWVAIQTFSLTQDARCNRQQCNAHLEMWRRERRAGSRRGQASCETLRNRRVVEGDGPAGSVYVKAEDLLEVFKLAHPCFLSSALGGYLL